MMAMSYTDLYNAVRFWSFVVGLVAVGAFALVVLIFFVADRLSRRCGDKPAKRRTSR
jgi:hypothetical protein